MWTTNNLFALLGLFSVSYVISTPIDYTGYKVIKFDIQTPDQLEFLSRFQNNETFISKDHQLAVGRSSTIGIPPTEIETITKQAIRLATDMHVIYEDLQSVIDLEKATVNQRTESNNFDFDVYHTYDDIVDQLWVWINSCPNNCFCSLYSYGNSIEGRSLWTIKIGRFDGNNNAYWMNGVSNAREWLGTATMLKVIDKFWSGFGEDDEVTQLVEDYDWYFSPVANPDGYVYSHEVDRMQHKNRAENDGSSCLGTDVNRNFDSQWGTDGASHDPCDDLLYCGDSVASERETRGIQNEMADLIARYDNLLGFVDIHTFGNNILMPYSYTDGQTCAQAPNHNDLVKVSNAFADGIEATFGTTWQRGTSCDISIPASGLAMDWAVEKGDAKYAFTPELRGDFFTAEPEQIDPSFQEFYNGIKAMVDEIADIEGL